jgi:hypothetical protein
VTYIPTEGESGDQKDKIQAVQNVADHPAKNPKVSIILDTIPVDVHKIVHEDAIITMNPK